MNKKHINSQLCRVFNNFLDSIDNEEVKGLIRKGTIITGGALVSLLEGEIPHDYDMYFKDFETCYKVAKYFTDKFNLNNSNRTAEVVIDKSEVGEILSSEKKYIDYNEALNIDKDCRIKIFIRSDGVASVDEDDSDYYEDDIQTNITPESDIENIEEKPKYVPKFLSSNAISLSGKIQLVIRFYGEPDKLHENYDFVHCTNYWTSWERKVTLNPNALESIINKELIYVGSKYPLCSIIRTRKFIKRGWTINAGQYLKMAMQLNELDLKNVSVLEDQLVGVDSTFFKILIDGLTKKKEEEPDFEVSNSYVASIVDKIF